MKYYNLQRLSYIQALDPSAQVIEDVPAKTVLSPLERARLRNIIRTYRGDMPCWIFQTPNLIELWDLSENGMVNGIPQLQDY